MSFPLQILRRILRKPMYLTLTILSTPALLFIAYNTVLVLAPQPPAVAEGQARRRAYLRRQITKEEYLHPELLRQRREREEREAQAQEAFEAEREEKRRGWDEVHEEGRRERDRVEVVGGQRWPRHPGS